MPRLFCSDEAVGAEDIKNIDMVYQTSPLEDYGYGFYAFVGLCK